MRGKRAQLTPLQARKKLLIVESELHRTLLLQECNAIAVEARKVARQMKLAAVLASSVMVVARGFRAFRSKDAAEDAGQNHQNGAGGKPSWTQRILSGLRLGTSLWTTIKAAQDRNARKSDE